MKMFFVVLGVLALIAAIAWVGYQWLLGSFE